MKILNLTVTGQKKYFVLTKTSLAYKTTEADPGFKEVYGGIVAAEQGPSPTSLLVTVKPGEVVALTASSPEEAASWLAALKQVFVVAPPAALATDAIADKPAEPVAVDSVEEPTMHESQLGDETTTMTEVAVDEPAQPLTVPPPAESNKAPSSWLFATCCGAE